MSAFNGRDAVRGQSMVRAADAMLRVLGGTEVVLRFATPGSGDTAVADDVPISPVVVIPLSAASPGLRLRYDFLVSATAAAELVESRAADSAEALFNSALGVLFQNRLLRIEGLAVELAGGVVCLHRITAGE